MQSDKGGARSEIERMTEQEGFQVVFSEGYKSTQTAPVPFLFHLGLVKYRR